MSSSFSDSFISFIAGANYGFASVIVGQPFDTIKTRAQAMTRTTRDGPREGSMISSTRSLWQKEGIRGLYRGGLPLFLGGSLFRSAQFGFYENTMRFLKANGAFKNCRIGPYNSEKRERMLDVNVVIAGFAGGIGRGLVEGPFEYIKVRRQVHSEWSVSKLYEGGGVTMLRNAFLFCSFSIYRALVPSLLGYDVDSNGKTTMNPFLEGAVCANLAWMTVWPLDVCKSYVRGDHVALPHVDDR